MRNPKKPGKKFYQGLAVGMTTDQEVVRSVVSGSLGWRAFKLNRIIAGVGNEVYEVESSEDGKKVILRINHHDDRGFRLEQWATSQVANRGVPFPKLSLLIRIL